MRKLVLGLAPVLMAISGTAHAAGPVWKISEVSGDVRLVENGRARTAAKGALLASGSTIATGANARAVIVRGEEFVVISPRTQVRVPAEAAPNRIMQLIQDFGSAVFKIQKKSTPHFGVQTPYLAAVVKGTTFTVTIGAEGGSVQVTEGAVEVSTLDGGAAQLVRPGDIAMVGASDLFRLNVEGEVTKAIRSPRAPAALGAGSVAAPHAAVYSGPRGREMRISQRLGENAKSLKDVTGGLVEGRSSHDMAQAEFRELARAARKEGSNPGNGDGNDKPDKGKDADKPKDDKPKEDKPKDPPPVDPSKPSEPGKPADPAPVDPGKPDEPTKPADPGKPGGDKPADPGKPSDPGKPDDPGKPTDPGKPADPGKPTDAGMPDIGGGKDKSDPGTDDKLEDDDDGAKGGSDDGDDDGDKDDN